MEVVRKCEKRVFGTTLEKEKGMGDANEQDSQRRWGEDGAMV